MIVLQDIIDAEKISALSFPDTEVLSSKDAVEQRFYELKRALQLGTSDGIKIKILLEDKSSRKVIEGNVFSFEENNIVLNSGISLPLHRVYRAFTSFW